MPAAKIPANETQRLNALFELNILDTDNDENFDAIVKVASLACGTPISLISLIDKDRQWFKANVGLPDVAETPRDFSFCAHAILDGGLLEVEDTTQDERFSDNPYVISDPKVRFYAGATLTLTSGENVGTLCVVDRKPYKLNEEQRSVLTQLAQAAVKALEGRRALARKLVDLCHRALENLTDNDNRFRRFSEHSSIGIFESDVMGAFVYTNSKWQDIYGLTFDESLGNGWMLPIHLDDRDSLSDAWQQAVNEQTEFSMAFRIYDRADGVKYVLMCANTVTDASDQVCGFVGSIEDITLRTLAQREREILPATIRSQFIVSITDKRGSIVEVNDSFCGISQYSRDELIGRNHRIINSGVHPPRFFEEMWHSISSGKPWRGDICNRAKDGSHYWVNSVIAPLFDAKGKVERYISIRSDVTQRKLQEESLRKSQALLNKSGAIAGVGGWEIDLRTNSIYWSEETCRIHGVPLGYKPTFGELIDFYAPEARHRFESAVKAAINNGTGWDEELPFIQANGTRIWVRSAGEVEFEQGNVIRVIAALQNITERVNQVQKLQDAKERMSLATNSGEIGVWEYDLVADELIWDPWMHRLYGRNSNEEQVSYSLWRGYVHKDDLPAAESALQDAINGIKNFDTEFRIVLIDGSLRHIRATAMTLRDRDGKAQRMIGVNWDVTLLRTLSSQLAEQHELLRVTLKSIGDAVITTDRAGAVTWLNPAAERMTAWPLAEAVGRPLLHVFHIINQETRLPTENPVATCLAEGKIAGLANHTLLISRDGSELGIEDSAAPIRDERGELLGAVLVFHDVTEKRRLSGEISYRATHDTLTGLINRTEFDNRLNRLLHRVHEEKTHHALMYIDLDQFKIVNDSCGHSGGDELLQQVCKLLTETVRNRDTLARLGGDEFGIILEYCSTDQAQRVAQSICEKMENYRFIHDDKRFRIGTSIGLVPMDNRWSNTAELMQAADTACYAAKEAGRNRVHVWFDTDTALRTRHGEMQWATRIEQALDDNRLRLYVQRINALSHKTDKLHAEVLLRFEDTDGTIIGPTAFLPAAERFHLATRIDRWVLNNAMSWLQHFSARNEIEMLCVNLSGQSVGDRAFHRQVMDILKKSGPDLCKRLCIEITETAAVTNLSDAALFIEQVHQLGVSVALDDFGAGASSFGYLKLLHIDVLKIDGQFIKDLLDDPLDDVAVRCFIDVAKVMKIKTIAEFVDNKDVLARLQDLGIDYAQGFLLHEPQPIEQLKAG